jgi:hypothetical protein
MGACGLIPEVMNKKNMFRWAKRIFLAAGMVAAAGKIAKGILTGGRNPSVILLSRQSKESSW